LFESASKFDRINGYLFHPTRDQIAVGNLVFMAFCVCAGALVGSLTSIYVICGIFYSTFYIWRGALPWQRDKAAVATAIAFAGFFLAELIAFAVNPGGDGLSEVASNLPFLGLFPIYSLLIADRDRLMCVIEKGAAFVAGIGAVAAIVSPAITEIRVELAAGNPGVLAVLASVLMLINITAVFRNGHAYRHYARAGILGSIIILLLSGMRALWPCMVIIPAMTLWAFGWKLPFRIRFKSLIVCALVVIPVGILVSGAVLNRVEMVRDDLQKISQNDFSSSIGNRIVLWRAAGTLIAQQPFFGFGPGNVTAKISEINIKTGMPESGFSHFHNMVINEMIRAGLAGLLAMISMFFVPLYFVLRAPKSEFRSVAVCMIGGLQAIYVLSGMTGIMIGHDILDTLFITVTALCLYLVRPSGSGSLKH
jgi:O-antigen ligase